MANRKRSELDLDKEKVEELYKSGMCPTKIGKTLNINYRTVVSHLTKVGLYTPKTRKKVKDDDNHEVTLEEKIAYCDKKYGKGNWHFMTKEEIYEALFLIMERKKEGDGK